MEIKVLGPGCAKCKTTYNVIEKVIKENNLDVKLTKVDDIMEMVSYNVMTTPAVVVDEVVKMKGQVPTESDVKKLLGRQREKTRMLAGIFHCDRYVYAQSQTSARLALRTQK